MQDVPTAHWASSLHPAPEPGAAAHARHRRRTPLPSASHAHRPLRPEEPPPPTAPPTASGRAGLVTAGFPPSPPPPAPWRRRVGRQGRWSPAGSTALGIDLPPGDEGRASDIFHGTGRSSHPTTDDGLTSCCATASRWARLRRLTGDEGLTRIGDRVDHRRGAIVPGPITVGDDAVIGAGAVVVDDVPRRSGGRQPGAG